MHNNLSTPMVVLHAIDDKTHCPDVALQFYLQFRTYSSKFLLLMPTIDLLLDFLLASILHGSCD